jgi:hypothetical protein
MQIIHSSSGQCIRRCLFAATDMLLKSIWSAPTNVRSDASHKLPDESLVIQPRAPEIRLRRSSQPAEQWRRENWTKTLLYGPTNDASGHGIYIETMIIFAEGRWGPRVFSQIFTLCNA